jgi:hypothetical protein
MIFHNGINEVITVINVSVPSNRTHKEKSDRITKRIRIPIMVVSVGDLINYFLQLREKSFMTQILKNSIHHFALTDTH